MLCHQTNETFDLVVLLDFEPLALRNAQLLLSDYKTYQNLKIISSNTLHCIFRPSAPFGTDQNENKMTLTNT